MALSDVNFQEGEGQDFLLELPTAIYVGSVNDILNEPSSAQLPVMELPESEGGDIFIMSE